MSMMLIGLSFVIVVKVGMCILFDGDMIFSCYLGVEFS